MLHASIRAFAVCSLFALALSAEASTPFQDAFISYAKIRQLEYRLQLLPYSGKEDAEIQADGQKISAELTAARIDFNAVARLDARDLTPWERLTLERIGKHHRPPTHGLNKEALDSLAQNFPHARFFTLTEWEVVRDWFGPETEAAFFKNTYAARSLPNVALNGNGETVLWVRTFANVDTLATRNSAPKQLAELKALLGKSGYRLELLSISPFAKIDDQAAELLQALTLKKNAGVILLTQADAGSLVYRALDIFPGLRKSESIKAWVNLNGRLYGEAPPATRAPASVSADPVDESAATAKTESYRLFGDNILRSPPLVDGFPILNVVSLAGPYRLKNSPRESIVPEGSTWLAPPGDPYRSVPAALSLVAGSAQPGNFRDNVSDPGF
jgi:hypothetical protein